MQDGAVTTEAVGNLQFTNYNLQFGADGTTKTRRHEGSYDLRFTNYDLRNVGPVAAIADRGPAAAAAVESACPVVRGGSEAAALSEGAQLPSPAATVAAIADRGKVAAASCRLRSQDGSSTVAAASCRLRSQDGSSTVHVMATLGVVFLLCFFARAEDNANCDTANDTGASISETACGAPPTPCGVTPDDYGSGGRIEMLRSLVGSEMCIRDRYHWLCRNWRCPPPGQKSREGKRRRVWP